jgi:hypothetical protein
MKEQTAVEWLIKDYFGSEENCSPLFRNKIKQAREMEKQQIIDAATWGFNTSSGDKYYNETFNNK